MFSKGCGFCHLEKSVRRQKVKPAALAAPAGRRTNIHRRLGSYILINTPTGNILVPAGRAGAAQGNQPRDWGTILVGLFIQAFRAVYYGLPWLKATLAARWASISYWRKVVVGTVVAVLILIPMVFLQLRYDPPTQLPYGYGAESARVDHPESTVKTTWARETEPEEVRQFLDEETTAWLSGKLFIRRDVRGEPLPIQNGAYEAEPWRCVSDSMSGMTWLVKDNTGGIHDKSHRFTLTTKLRGQNSYYSKDILTYRDRVRAQNPCGATDWRLPSVAELKSLAYPHLSNSFPYWPGIHLWARNENGELVIVAAQGLLGREHGKGFGPFSGTASALLVRGSLHPCPIPPEEDYVVVRFIVEFIHQPE
ncbi:MAG: hypothetical protein WBB23_22710 [Desulforhopalus sp.]